MDIVIPAHDEEKIIARTINRIIGTNSISIAIIANACSDATAEVASAVGGDGTTVLETDRPGKAHALNLGDARCSRFPRAYLDADVELDGEGLSMLGEAMRDTGAQLAVPAVRIVDDRSSWVTRAYLRAWRALPSVREGGAGRGVYVLSSDGHAKVFPLPEDLIADDAYVDRLIRSEDRVVVPEVVVIVHAPRDLRSLVRRRVRVIAGNRQLDALGLTSSSHSSGLRALSGLIRGGQVRALDAAVFTGVSVAVRGLDLVRRLRGGEIAWGTDSSSREGG